MFSSWLYISNSDLSAGEVETELADIVAQARARNHSMEVTGALLFTGTAFAQFIEGPECSVQSISSSIERDPRHRELLTLPTGRWTRRRFDRWSLSYSGPSSLVAKVVDTVIADARINPPKAVDALLHLLDRFTPMA